MYMDCRDRIVSQDYVEILVDYDPAFIREFAPQAASCFQPLGDGLGILYVSSVYTQPLSISQYRYTYIPKCYGLLQIGLGDVSYEQTGSFRAQNPPLSLTGKEVLIGMIDTGIRPSLSVFQREDGSSRILALWDQTDESGISPEGFLYGSQYLGDTLYRERLLIGSGQPQQSRPLKESGPAQQSTFVQDVRQEQEDSQLQELSREAQYLENIDRNLDTIGHGTAAASVALTCAPDAHLIMVKCRQAKQYLREYYEIPSAADAYAETDIMTGLAYLRNISDKLGLPMVICITMGTNMGSHASHSLLDRFLTSLGNRRGMSIVIGGGNEGNQAHHFSARIQPQGDRTYEDMEINVAENTQGFFLEIWGSLPAIYTISLRSPDGEEIPRIPIRYGQTQEYSFIYSQTVVRLDYLLVERASAQQLITLRFGRPLAGIWTIRVYMEQTDLEGVFHAWLPIADFVNRPISFLRPDPYATMTEPSYLAESMSVTYYDAANGSFAIDSGRGYEEDGLQFFGLQVPDLSAPGINVDTVLGKRSGSSIATALAGGCAAQFLEWAVTRQRDPLVNSKGVRNYFIRGAVRESGQEYPLPTWGYGKLSLTGVFDVLRG